MKLFEWLKRENQTNNTIHNSIKKDFFEEESFLENAITENELSYINIPTERLTDEQIRQCSELFSNHYGRYSMRSKMRPGEQVKMGTEYYKKNYCVSGFSVALALHDNNIVGQAFYLRKRYESIGIMTWIVQLVVNSSYRKQGVASTLLRSIWGFSDDYAWGLATANPCTVRTLESATMRKCKPQVMHKHDHLSAIRKIGKDITFVRDGNIEITAVSSQIDSGFDIDNSGFSGKEEYERRLGALKPGREWVAFTFHDQGIQAEQYAKNFSKIIEFSEKQLLDAYSRMPIEQQGWAQGTSAEIDYILKKVGRVENAIDLGCGIGRHTIELVKRNISTMGVDYSQRHIDYAKKKCIENGIVGVEFQRADLRQYTTDKKYDLAICLYDVIGSYPDEKDNLSIIRSSYNLLSKNGYLVISVMNMELTQSSVPAAQKGDIRKNPQILLKLTPSQIMQKTGNIFSPQYLAIDTPTGIVYRKEQFTGDTKLPAEYVIRDKRYTLKEIVGLLEKEGFTVVTSQYVRAGHFDETLRPTDKHAKEILVIARKETS